MGAVTAKFLQHRPTVQVQISGPYEDVVDWVVDFKKTFSDEEVTFVSTDVDYVMQYACFVLEKKRRATSSLL